MKTFDLVVPCHFGLEAVTKREIYKLGYEITKMEDGRVTFTSDAEEICLSLIRISKPTKILSISYAVFCLKKNDKERARKEEI